MNLEIATEKDNDQLLKFFESFESVGQVNFRLRRGPDFFSWYRTQGEESRTYVLRDKNEIHACATFSIREARVKDKIVRVAQASDLRVSNSRKAIISWGQHFLPVLKEVETDLKVDHVFSSINLSDPSALNTFIRPRNIKRPLPRYYLYRKFSLVGLHGRFPTAEAPLSTLQIRRGSSANAEALYHYLIHRSQFRPFSTNWNAHSIQRKMARLKGLDLSKFLVAFDSHENVVGCCALWDPQALQRWVPLTYPSLRAHNFRQFLKFGQLIGWTRALSKPLSRTKVEIPLQFQLLTFVNADNEDILESLFWVAYESVGSDTFLAYTHCDQDFRLKPPESWIASHTPYALYSVVDAGSPPPDFLHPSEIHNPELEAFLL